MLIHRQRRWGLIRLQRLLPGLDIIFVVGVVVLVILRVGLLRILLLSGVRRFPPLNRSALPGRFVGLLLALIPPALGGLRIRLLLIRLRLVDRSHVLIRRIRFLNLLGRRTYVLVATRHYNHCSQPDA